MTGHHDTTPPAVYLLADHLDAVLASGEDLLAAKADVAAAPTAAASWDEVRTLVARARTMELSIVSRVLQARARARDLGHQDGLVGAMMRMFVGGTAIVPDALTELADRTGVDFDAGLDPLAYLRTRGLIPPDAGSLAGIERITVGEDFLIARRIPLGPVLDAAAALLDALDAAHHLFGEDVATRPGAGAAAPRPEAAEGKSQGLGQA